MYMIIAHDAVIEKYVHDVIMDLRGLGEFLTLKGSQILCFSFAFTI